MAPAKATLALVGGGWSMIMKRFDVCGGVLNENDDVASEKSGPAEGVGVRGRSPWVDNHFQY